MSEMARRDVLKSLVVLPLGVAITGCGEEDKGPSASPDACGVQGESNLAFGHTHTVCILQATLDEPPKAGVTITTDRMGDTHTHTITLTQAQLMSLTDVANTVTVNTSVDSEHMHQFVLQGAGASADMG